jgi:CubicO group peptidase (beta-lactamase class C family)
VRHKDDLVKLLALISFLTLSLGCTQAGGEAANGDFDLSSNIDAVLREASSDGSGFAIIVELDGEIVLSKGYGYADRARNSAFTPASIAQIGSLTKQFNAAAILHLAEAGEVELAAPLKNYIAEVEPPVGDVTLHQLLTHSSGLPEYCGDDFEPVSRDEFVEICLSSPLVFEPGTDVAYSNIGYGAIAAVIEFVTEQNFEAYLEDEVLRMNGLRATGHLFPENLDAVFARGYLEDKDMGNIAEQIEALEDNWWNLKGNGGMQSSTQDMYAWYQVLSGEGVLSDNVRAELTAPHSPWSDGVAEGYGWYFRSDDGAHIRQMSHSGSDGVFFSYYWHRIDKRAFMYFVGNSGEEPTKKVLREILAIFNTMFDGPQ